MRRYIIAGNWKMYKTITESIELANSLKRELIDCASLDIVLCPNYVALSEVQEVVYGTNIEVGAQNVFWQEEGAFTGEVSAAMIKDVGCKYVIIGHSERRQYFNETNETVNKRITHALKHELIPIVCVGENLKQRESEKTFEVVEDHIKGALGGFAKEELSSLIIAYEPVWAIGTGKTATPDQAQQVHKFIRDLLVKLFDEEFASSVRIQYGGSVKPENANDLMTQNDIDGALVGGASLKVDSFVKIVKITESIIK
ncbi:MAG: triose-phosphate isomerase [Candidatus Gygaella obscura]|nr:triose-phosphate isomerase [Candidatus Gygaella obscura]